MIANTGIAETLAQFVGNQFSVRPCRRHAVNEPSHVVGKIMVTIFGQ